MSIFISSLLINLWFEKKFKGNLKRIWSLEIGKLGIQSSEIGSLRVQSLEIGKLPIQNLET